MGALFVMFQKSMNFIRCLHKEKKGNFLTRVFKFGGLLAVWKS